MSQPWTATRTFMSTDAKPLLTAKSRKPGALRDAKMRRRPRDEVCGLGVLTEGHSIGRGPGRRPGTLSRGREAAN